MPTLYLLKITLLGTEKPIWRRFVVPSDMKLNSLHEVIQAVMGWENGHLHGFTDGRREFFPAEAEMDGTLPEERFKLAEVAPKKGERIFYVYDLGDSWEHEIVVEDCDYSNAEWPYPIYCLEGERACPPEDCGGVWGFADFCEAMADKNHPEHEELKEWYGGKFDPKKFDPADVNKRFGFRPVKAKKPATPKKVAKPRGVWVREKPETNDGAAKKKTPAVKKTAKKATKKKIP